MPNKTMTNILNKRISSTQKHYSSPTKIALGLSLCAYILSGYAEDNTQQFVTNGTYNGGNNFHVGKTGTNNYLIVAQNGILKDRNGYIGNKNNANHNAAWINGAGSIWKNRNLLIVGNYGSSNNLTIRNGGKVYSKKGYVGRNKSATGNRVLLTGTDTSWGITKDLIVGRKGSNNHIKIQNGAKLFNTTSRIGSESTANGNQVLVAGNGSVWTNTSMYVGYSGTSNQLQITSGGHVLGTSLNLGQKVGAHQNRLQVDGAGSILALEKGLKIGRNSKTNQLIISNGGLVSNTTGYIGSEIKAYDNTVIVQDTGSIWTNRGTLHIGYRQDRNSLTVTNGGVVFSKYADLGYYKSAKKNEATITGSGSAWIVQKDLQVGRDGSNNHLYILDQGLVKTDANFHLGLKTNATANTALIDQSTLSVSNEIFIGNMGSKNSFVITNGGITTAKTSYLGYTSAANQNQATVTGNGSKWTTDATLDVGQEGSENQLLVTDGGKVESFSSTIGHAEGANENSITIQGNGSALNNHNLLRIGYRGSTNQLTISDGGLATTKTLYIGQLETANHNTLSLTGSQSKLFVTNSLFLGYRGSDNTLNATDGAYIETEDAVMGRYAGAENNTVSLSNAKWKAQDFYVGKLGNKNKVELRNAAVAEAVNTYLGYKTLSNSILIDGSGTMWTNYATFFVGGTTSTGNVVQVNNGGSLFSGALAVRSGNSFKMNNGASTLISGGSSATLPSGGQLLIGENQGNNTFSITDGGKVEVGETILGLLSAATANTATIEGENSQWNATRFVLGDQASDNTLTVSNGGQLYADSLIIGNTASSGNNRVRILGNTSQITLTGALDIGVGEASGNRLDLLSSGQLSAQTSTIHNHATLHLENGFLVSNNHTLIQSGGTLSGWGQISGTVTNMGIINIGDTTHFETLSFSDQLILTDASEIIFDLASLNEYDKVEVTQEITFDGKLTVRLTNNFTPQLGDTFNLFNWGNNGSPGNFSQLNLPPFATGSSLSWDTSNLSTDGSIKAIPEPMVLSFIGFFALFFITAHRLFKHQ